MIIYCIVASFLNALAAVVLGSSVLLKGPKRHENHLFAWFTASFAAWSLFYLLWQLSLSEKDALFYTRALTGASIFISITYFHFVSRLTSRRGKVEIRLGYAFAVCVAAFSFSPYLVKGVGPAMMFPYWPQPGPVFWAWITALLYFIVRAWMVLVEAWRNATHWRKKQLGYVCFGSVAGWLGGLTNLFLWVGIPIPPFGHGLALIYILSVGYAMMRFRLVDINLMVVKGMVYLFFVAVLSLVFPLFSLVLQYWPEGMADLSKIAEYLAAFLATALLFVFARRFTQKLDAFLEEKAFSSYGGDKARLREHMGAISTFSGVKEIFEESVIVISKALKVSHVEIFYRPDYEVDYEFQAASDEDRSFFDGKKLGQNDWMVQKTRSSGKALVVYEQERFEANAIWLAQYEAAGVDLAIPIRADRFFYGMILFGAREGNRLYSDFDISLLEAVGIQIGLTIRARELERRSNQTEKLISLGTLAAGLAHELRNPLVSITTFTELIAEQGEDAEFRQQFQNIVGRDVKRIGAIIDQVGAFARNPTSNFRTVSLPQVIQDVCDIAKPELVQSGVSIVVQDDHTLPTVRANYSQMIQVFLNLVQNAIQAFAGEASPSIHISFTMKKGRDGSTGIVVAVADNGPGIAAGIRSRIFDPFVTTKDTGARDRDRGMGLGLGIVKCIVEAHGGSIDVASTIGVGTTFYVELPCDEGRRGSETSRGNPKDKKLEGLDPRELFHSPALKETLIDRGDGRT